jgi:WS/DGAT/MGAT family acyltransferase
MDSYGYDRLSALDTSFLVFEGPNTHMHVAATSVFECGPLATPQNGVDIDRVRSYIESRLHLIPRYRQRLAHIPLLRHPVWVDDDRFNLAYHVRHTSLPRPGDPQQLKRLAARILSQQLDRGKPLWEIWVVEGLEGGRFALVSKTHHCMIDGISGVDLLSVLLDTEPTSTIEDPPPWVPRPQPGRFELVLDEAIRRINGPLELVARALTHRDEVVHSVREGLEAISETLAAAMRPASPTPFNQPIGPHRRFDWTSFDLAEVRHIKNQLGGTVNDVVLATVAGAVRRFLERRRLNVCDLVFRAFVPVSVRVPEERGTLGNRVAGWLAELPVSEPDPHRRLAKVQETTAHLKESKQALGAEMLTQVGEWTGSTLLSLAVRLSTRFRPFNLVVTNVPGPQVPLYLLGARMLEIYPQVPLFVDQGMGIALFSYAGRLFWGVTADWDLLPDLRHFVEALQAAFAELRGLAREARPAPPRRRARAGRGRLASVSA